MISQFVADAGLWAAQVFSASSLPDVRLGRRLVTYAGAQAIQPAASTARATGSSSAEREGAYRLLENGRVRPSDIEEGPFYHTSGMCRGVARLLIVQDTTGVSVGSPALKEELKNIGGPTGFLVHTSLAVDGTTGEAIGILDQRRWTRARKSQGSGTRRPPQDFEERESARWLVADMAGRDRLDQRTAAITVCDREADIYEFLAHHVEHNQRFVIRAQHNRKTSGLLDGLHAEVSAAAVCGGRVVRVEQRGVQREKIPQKAREGRQRRDVRTTLQGCRVTIQPPANGAGRAGAPAIEVNVVQVKEVDGDLEWILLTSEPVDTLAQVEQIVRDYEHRWTIEEFHRTWKTGCRLEARSLQTADAFERMMVITAPIAVRLMQLHMAARSDRVDKTEATSLSDEEQRCLWAITEKKPFPKRPPSAKWAVLAVGRLGGFYDSKRTGRIGCLTMWIGWSTFQVHLTGWNAARAVGP